MSFLKGKKPDKTAQWLGGLDFSMLVIEDIIDDITEERIQGALKILQNCSKNRNSPTVLSAAKITSRIAYPTELITGIRKRIFEAGIIPELLYFGQQGYIRPYPIIERNDLVFGKEIAKGSGGSVFEGKWNEKDVAIKICGKMGMFFTCEEAFRFETTVMSLLEHPNIMICYGANESDPEPYIIMPLFEFGTLTDVLKNTERQLPWSQKLHLVIQLSEAVKHMHKCGLIHRDLKPSNVLVGSDFTVSLIDFGISRVYEAKRPMTMNVGTTSWIAPEIFDGNGTYTSAVDVYSFGIILCEVMTEQAPFSGLGLQSFDVPLQVVKGVRPIITDVVPPEISLLIQQCWHANPKKRPPFEKISERLVEIQSDIMWFKRPASASPAKILDSPTNDFRHQSVSQDIFTTSDTWSQSKNPKHESAFPVRSNVVMGRSLHPSNTTNTTNASNNVNTGFSRIVSPKRDRGTDNAVNIGRRVEDSSASSRGKNRGVIGERTPPRSPDASISRARSSVDHRKRSKSDTKQLTKSPVTQRNRLRPKRSNTDKELDIDTQQTSSTPANELQEPEDNKTKIENKILDNSAVLPSLLNLPGGYQYRLAQILNVKITAVTFIEGNIYWIGTENGQIIVLKASNDNDHTQSICEVVHEFKAHENTISSMVTVPGFDGLTVWTTSLCGSTACWDFLSYHRKWEYSDKLPMNYSRLIEINNHNRVWTTGENDSSMRVWNPSDCKKVSKIVVVPPPGVESLIISCIVPFGDYVLIAAHKWIYIYDGLSFQAFSYWQAHDEVIRGLAVLNNKIWSFCENSSQIKLWTLDLQNGRMISLKQILLSDFYSQASLEHILQVEETIWCFYKDGTLSVVDANLKQTFSSKWGQYEEGINSVMFSKEQILITSNKLLLGLTKIPSETVSNTAS